MKRFLVLALCLVTLLISVLPVTALAYSYDYNNPSYESYTVTSPYEGGIIYLYDQPTTSFGKNLGEYNNGTIVKVIDLHAADNMYMVICPDGRVGYMRNDWLTLTSKMENTDDNLYVVFSVSPAGYCYMYDRPSSSEGKSLGQYDNFEFIQIIDMNADKNYAYVRACETGKCGYISKKALIPANSSPIKGWMVVNCAYPNEYCYMYDKPTSSYGKNLGQFYDGTVLGLIDNSDSDFALVYSPADGKIGYISKNSLMSLF